MKYLKPLLAILILTAIGCACYFVPVKHHRAATGVYFMKDYYAVTTATGIVGWTPGQQVREVLRAPAVQGAITVTDGRIAIVMPESMLSQNVEDAEAARLADRDGQEQAKSNIAAVHARALQHAHSAQLTSAKDLDRINSLQIAASTVGNYATRLNEPPRPVGTYYYPTFISPSNYAVRAAMPASTPVPIVSTSNARPPVTVSEPTTMDYTELVARKSHNPSASPTPTLWMGTAH